MTGIFASGLGTVSQGDLRGASLSGLASVAQGDVWGAHVAGTRRSSPRATSAD